jgi:hypothetical protein
MKSMLMRGVVTVVTGLLLTGVAGAADFGFHGWGPRVGISEDPDQITGGVHVDFGEFAPGVRFQPSVEIGFGDDVFSVLVNGMVAYYFPLDINLSPYAGGQLSAAYYNLDNDCDGFGRKFGSPTNCDDSETEIGAMAVGGIELELSGGNRFLAEIQLGISDLPDVKLVAGWTF